MPRYPGARWEPVGNFSDGPMRSYLGHVLHCNDAESLDLHDWIVTSTGPGREPMSCHFQVTAHGTVYQYLDTAVQSWAQGNGNPDYLSIESEGLASEPATPAQIKAIGAILAWAHQVHGIPLQLAERPGERGLGWHGMGAAHGQPGWGHPACPGVRRDQRPAMLAAAQGGYSPTEDTLSQREVDDINTHTVTQAESVKTLVRQAQAQTAAQICALANVVKQLTQGDGQIDMTAVQTAAEAGATAAVQKLHLEVD